MLRKTSCKSLNGRAAHHKNFKTYVRSANMQDEIQCVNPYNYFKYKTEMGRYQPLTKDQFLQFWDYYQEPLIHPTHRAVLLAFLFSCVTGMRHSDVRRFNLDWFDNHNIEDSDDLAANFVGFGLTVEDMESIAKDIPDVHRNPIFSWLNQVLTTEKLVDEIEDASQRTNDLVSSVKSYTHMELLLLMRDRFKK